MTAQKLSIASIISMIIIFIVIFVASCSLMITIQEMSSHTMHANMDIGFFEPMNSLHEHLAIPMTLPEPLTVIQNTLLFIFTGFVFFVLRFTSSEDKQYIRQKYRKRTLFPVLTHEYLFLFQKGILNGKTF